MRPEAPAPRLRLYYHPFASFCQKVLIALYEKALPFEPVTIDLGDPEQRERLAQLWPLAKFPVLRDEENDVTLPESGIIIEYLDRLAPGAPPLVPADPDQALRARQWERFFDSYVAAPLTKVVTDEFRPDGGRDPVGVAEAKALIARAFDLFDAEIGGRDHAAGPSFSLADCAAAPSLFYANTVVPMASRPNLAAYYDRLLARPSFRRVVDEARPYRHLFPLPWPPSYS